MRPLQKVRWQRTLRRAKSLTATAIRPDNRSYVARGTRPRRGRRGHRCRNQDRGGSRSERCGPTFGTSSPDRGGRSGWQSSFSVHAWLVRHRGSLRDREVRASQAQSREVAQIMQFRALLELLGISPSELRAQAARRRYENELFPPLAVTRLEERRLLNAAPVAVAPTPPLKDAAADAASAPADDAAGSDIANLAVTMYGGPAHGDLTPEMQSLTQDGTNAGPVSNDAVVMSTGAGASTSNSTPAVVSIQTVTGFSTPTNDPPVNAVPGPQSTNEDTPLVIHGLAVSDVDSGASPITTQFTVTQGVLSVDVTGGIVQPSGAILLPDGTVITGNGTSTLTITGSTAQISNELSLGLTYTPNLNYNGSDLLTMTSNDLGATGLGGPLKDIDTVAIGVAAVNDPPVNAVPGPQSTNEDTPLVILGLSVSDPDADVSPITTQFTVNQGVLSVDTTGGVVKPGGIIQLPDGTVITGNGTSTLLIIGTTAQISNELSLGLTYTPNLNYNGSDLLTMTSNDLGAFGLGGPQTDIDTVAITVAAVNDPPVNAVPGPQSTNEDTPLVIHGLSVSDVDSGASPITTQFTVTQGVLSVDVTGGIVQPSGAILLPDGTVITGNGTSTLTITGSTAQISNELSLGLTYTPNLNYNGSDLLTMTSNDLGATGLGGPLKDIDIVAITVVAVNDPPVNAVPGPQSTNEDTPLVIHGLAVSDVDSGASPITTQFTVTQGVLNVDVTGGIVQPSGAILLPDGTVITGNGTSTLTITGSTAQISNELSLGLTYTPNLNYNGSDLLTMTSNDLGATGLGGPLKDIDTVAITVVAVNDPPVNAVPGPQSTNEDTPLVIHGLAVSDVDSGASPITTQFTVTQGVLNVDVTGGIVQPSGAILLPDGTVITGNGTSTLTITGSTAQISNELSLGLTYTPNLNYNGSDLLTMTSNDLGATGLGGPLKDIDTVAITVVAVNDPPVNAVPGPQSTNEDTPLVIHGLSVSDVDSGASPITTQFTVTQGVLNVDVTGGIVQPSGAILLPDGTVITGNGTSTLTITGSTAQISNELSLGLTYTPNLNYNGSDLLTMTSNDLGATGLGGPLKDIDTVAITVTPVAINAPPINVVPGPQSTNENVPLVIHGLAVSDVDSGASPITTQFTVTQGVLSVDVTGGLVQPSGAILLPDGTVITGNGTNTLTIIGSTAQISDELSLGLTYTPTFAYYGPDTLTMNSNDLGATGLGGPQKDIDTVAITVVPVVHAPTLNVTSPASGFNGVPILISISGALTDSNKPEVLTFDVSGVPTDAILHDGLGFDHTGQSSYTFSVAEVTGLTLTMPDSNTSSTFDLTVTAVATDAALNQTASSAPATIIVSSLNPYPILTGVSAPNVNQGSTTTLTGNLTSLRPGSFPMEVTVTWGDGSPPETIQVDAQGQFTSTHTYLYGDSNPSPTETNLIHVSVTDQFGKTTEVDIPLVVSNVAPSINNLVITPGDLQINNAATLTGQIADPGPFDTFQLTVDWGDGTTPDTIALPAGTTSFTLTHLFDDNRRGQPDQVNPVQVSVVDVHSGLGTAATAITVHDVPPILVNYTGTDLGSNGILTIAGSVSHPGSSPLTLTINWEDTVQVIQNVPQGNFQISHFYAAPPDPANPSAPITVVVTVSDDTNLSAAGAHTSGIPGLGPTGGASQAALALFYVQQQTTLSHFATASEHIDYLVVQPIVLSFTTVQFDNRTQQGEVFAAAKPVVALSHVRPRHRRRAGRRAAAG